MEPKGAQMEPRRDQKEAEGSQKGAKGEPKGAKSAARRVERKLNKLLLEKTSDQKEVQYSNFTILQYFGTQEGIKREPKGSQKGAKGKPKRAPVDLGWGTVICPWR